MTLTRTWAAALGAVALCGVGGAVAANLGNHGHQQNASVPARAPRLTVVELFQSQGCSDCPPANANVNALAADPNVLALSYGVTYWDQLGWKDSFAEPQYTARQWEYAKARKRGSVWTPQVYVNGQADVVGSNRAQLDQRIAAGRIAGPAVAIKIVSEQLDPQPQRTVLRPFRITGPENEGKEGARTARIVQRVLALEPKQRDDELRALVSALEQRHDNVAETLDRRFQDLKEHFDGRLDLDEQRGRLVAAFLAVEYSIEAAALFNPSAVPHFDQSGVEDGATRFIMSLRGIGEGHVSSLLFQTGLWHADDTVTFDERGPCAVGPAVALPVEGSDKRTAEFDFRDGPIGERVIYPFLPSQGRGLEDARFCLFTEDDGASFYRGTFTAFDGQQTRQAVLRTDDFRHLVARRLDGDLAFTKGAAWFPRRIDGRYAMLGRLDEESIYLFLSENPDEWHGGEVIIAPRFGWEAVQMGNCGSPMEIDEGWLVLTHGVGQARTYCMGAALLDRDDPSRVLARTREPILRPCDDEQGGYVPNVVYSCGGFVHGRTLLLPFGVADNYASMGTVHIDDLVSAMS